MLFLIEKKHIIINHDMIPLVAESAVVGRYAVDLCLGIMGYKWGCPLNPSMPKGCSILGVSGDSQVTDRL